MNLEVKLEIVNFLALSGSKDSRLRAVAGLSPRGWKRLLEWMDLAGLTLSFWDRVKKSEVTDIVPPQFQTSLERNLAEHRLRVAAMAEEFDAINRSFDCAGVAYAALKGFALVPDYIPDPGLRPFYDFDYLIPRASSELADRVFSNAGYKQKSKRVEHSLTYFHPGRESRLPSTRDDLYSLRVHRTVDVHFGIWEFDSLGLELDVPPRPLSRSRLRVWQGLCFSVLSEEDQLLFQVLHILQHVLNHWCRLRWLLDVATYLNSQAWNATFWTRFQSLLAHDPRLLDIASVVFEISARLFRAQLPPELLLSRKPELALWMERYGMTSALDNFGHDKYSLFLHRYFVRERESWRRLRKERLFPIQRPVQVGKPSAPGFSNHALAHWKQACYVAGRALHHLRAGAQYGWQSLRWRHEQSRLREMHSPVPQKPVDEVR